MFRVQPIGLSRSSPRWHRIPAFLSATNQNLWITRQLSRNQQRKFLGRRLRLSTTLYLVNCPSREADKSRKLAYCLSCPQPRRRCTVMTSANNEQEEWEKFFIDASPMLYKDDDVVVFQDRSPRALTHLLVVPRHRHIRGVEDLTPSDMDLVQKMGRIGAQFAKSDAVSMGFHVWPLRSIDHLHLHCLVPPFEPWWQKYRYIPLVGFVKLSAVERRLSKS